MDISIGLPHDDIGLKYIEIDHATLRGSETSENVVELNSRPRQRRGMILSLNPNI